jgi:hypothetical protein
VSGGHWDYLAHKLGERAEYAGEIWELLAAIEHELDWGLSGDTCYECAKIRTIRALESFFDSGASLITTAIRLLRSKEPECERCRARMEPAKPTRAEHPNTIVTVEVVLSGQTYKGVLAPQ